MTNIGFKHWSAPLTMCTGLDLSLTAAWSPKTKLRPLLKDVVEAGSDDGTHGSVWACTNIQHGPKSRWNI